MIRKIWWVLGFGVVIRIILFRYLTYYQDLYTYQDWSLAAIRYGFGQFYDRVICDYLPGYIYILWGGGKIYYFVNAKIGFLPVELAYKLPSMVGDLISSIGVFLIVKKISGEKRALWTAGIYLFNPVVIMNSTLWGQTDGLVMCGLVWMVYFLINKKITLAAVCLGLAQLIKPIAVLVAPIWLLYMLSKQWNRKDLIKFIFIAAGVFGAGFLPFSGGKNIGEFIWQRLTFTTSFWPLTSLNAFNFWGLISTLEYGHIAQISSQKTFLELAYKFWGWLAFGAIYILAIIKSIFWIKKKNFSGQRVVFLSAGIYLAMFWWLTGMHERHIYLAVANWIILSRFAGKKMWISTFGLSLVGVFNMFMSYYAAGILKGEFSSWSIVIFCLIGGVVLFDWLRSLIKADYLD